MRVFLANVGANSSHRHLFSPLFDDGTFEFLPIPEGGPEEIVSKDAPKLVDRSEENVTLVAIFSAPVRCRSTRKPTKVKENAIRHCRKRGRYVNRHSSRPYSRPIRVVARTYCHSSIVEVSLLGIDRPAVPLEYRG